MPRPTDERERSRPAPAVTARCLFAGDTHGDAAWTLLLAETAARLGCRTVFVVGDFGVWPGAPGARFLDAVDAAAADHGVEYAFVDGNHDDHDQLAAAEPQASGWKRFRERVWYAPRGHRWQWHGVRFAAAGGAVSVDAEPDPLTGWAGRVRGKDWWPEETLTDAGEARVAAGGPCDVLVTHDCPHGVPLPVPRPHAFRGAPAPRPQDHRSGRARRRRPRPPPNPSAGRSPA